MSHNVLYSHAQEELQNVTSLRSQAQKTDSAVALNINYTAQTLIFHLVLHLAFLVSKPASTAWMCFVHPCHPLSRKRKKKKNSGHKGSFNDWTERRNWVRNAGITFWANEKPKEKYCAKCFEWLGVVKESCARLKSRKKHMFSTCPCIGRGNRWSPKTQIFVK